MNLLSAPTHKIEDRKAILERVHQALLSDRDARFNFKGEWKKPSTDEDANWEARQMLTQIKQTFPSTLLVDGSLVSVGTEE